MSDRTQFQNALRQFDAAIERLSDHGAMDAEPAALIKQNFVAKFFLREDIYPYYECYEEEGDEQVHAQLLTLSKAVSAATKGLSLEETLVWLNEETAPKEEGDAISVLSCISSWEEALALYTAQYLGIEEEALIKKRDVSAIDFGATSFTRQEFEAVLKRLGA